MRAVTFLIRHVLFVAAAMAVGCVLWTGTYVVLLLVAVVTNSGLGGPLAWPAGIVAILGACAVVGWGVFTPSCAIGSAFCRRLRLPRLAAVPVVFAAAGLLSYLWCWAFGQLHVPHSAVPIGTFLKNYVLYLSLPLGVYWWLTEGPGALFDALRRWVASRRRRTDDGPREG